MQLKKLLSFIMLSSVYTSVTEIFDPFFNPLIPMEDSDQLIIELLKKGRAPIEQKKFPKGDKFRGTPDSLTYANYMAIQHPLKCSVSMFRFVLIGIMKAIIGSQNLVIQEIKRQIDINESKFFIGMMGTIIPLTRSKTFLDFIGIKDVKPNEIFTLQTIHKLFDKKEDDHDYIFKSDPNQNLGLQIARKVIALMYHFEEYLTPDSIKLTIHNFIRRMGIASQVQFEKIPLYFVIKVFLCVIFKMILDLFNVLMQSIKEKITVYIENLDFFDTPLCSAMIRDSRKDVFERMMQKTSAFNNKINSTSRSTLAFSIPIESVKAYKMINLPMLELSVRLCTQILIESIFTNRFIFITAIASLVSMITNQSKELENLRVKQMSLADAKLDLASFINSVFSTIILLKSVPKSIQVKELDSYLIRKQEIEQEDKKNKEQIEKIMSGQERFSNSFYALSMILFFASALMIDDQMKWAVRLILDVIIAIVNVSSDKIIDNFGHLGGRLVRSSQFFRSNEFRNVSLLSAMLAVRILGLKYAQFQESLHAFDKTLKDGFELLGKSFEILPSLDRSLQIAFDPSRYEETDEKLVPNKSGGVIKIHIGKEGFSYKK